MKKREDFTWLIDGYGYSLYYKGKFVCGATTDRTKKKTIATQKKNQIENRKSVDAQINYYLYNDLPLTY